MVRGMLFCASDKHGSDKPTTDYIKVLRESKVILLDNIVNRDLVTIKETKGLLLPSFQVNGLEGEMKLMKLSAPGLHTVQRLGSIDVPRSVRNLSILKQKIIPRLKYMKARGI